MKLYANKRALRNWSEKLMVNPQVGRLASSHCLCEIEIKFFAGGKCNLQPVDVFAHNTLPSQLISLLLARMARSCFPPSHRTGDERPDILSACTLLILPGQPTICQTTRRATGVCFGAAKGYIAKHNEEAEDMTRVLKWKPHHRHPLECQHCIREWWWPQTPMTEDGKAVKFQVHAWLHCKYLVKRVWLVPFPFSHLFGPSAIECCQSSRSSRICPRLTEDEPGKDVELFECG